MCNRLNTRTVVLFLQETATSLPTLELFVRMKATVCVIHIFLHSRNDEFQTRTARVRMHAGIRIGYHWQKECTKKLTVTSEETISCLVCFNSR